MECILWGSPSDGNFGILVIHTFSLTTSYQHLFDTAELLILEKPKSVREHFYHLHNSVSTLKFPSSSLGRSVVGRSRLCGPLELSRACQTTGQCVPGIFWMPLLFLLYLHWANHLSIPRKGENNVHMLVATMATLNMSVAFILNEIRHGEIPFS